MNIISLYKLEFVKLQNINKYKKFMNLQFFEN